jgi:hypothetical protein
VLSPCPEQDLIQLQDKNGLGTKRNINVMFHPPASFESSEDDDDSTVTYHGTEEEKIEWNDAMFKLNKLKHNPNNKS